MYKTLLFFYCCCFAFTSTAQNLLLNGDFEEYWECPSNTGQINLCKNVFDPCVGTSDYFNSCSSNNESSVPINFFGYQAAFSGNGYIGAAIIFKVNEIYGGEYIQIKLKEKLKKGLIVNFSFYICLAEYSSVLSNHIGVKFVEDSIIYNDFLWKTMKPDWVNSDNILFYDTLNWINISGHFVSKGNEEWMIIGAFTDLFYLYSSGNVLYLEKDVRLNNMYLFIDNCWANYEELTFPNVFTPNYDGINDKWTINVPYPENVKILEINIFNRWGKSVFETGSDFTHWDGNCNGQPCSEGVYFATVIIENKSNNSIKRYSGYITLLR